MARRFAFIAAFSALFSLWALFAAPQARASSYPVVLNDDGPTAAQQLERLYRLIRPAFWQNANEIPGTPEGSGGAYEITASVQGRVGCGGPDLLILDMHGSSIDALVPHSFQPNWLNSGEQLRFIVRDNPQPTDSSAPGYKVLAVAPDNEVSQIENAAAPHARASASSAHSAHYASENWTESDPRLPTNLPAGHPIVRLSDAATAVYPFYRNAVHNYNPRLDDHTLDTITTAVLGYSDYYKLDPRLVMSMIIAESGFDPDSISSTGAVGIGQLMPETAAGLGVNPYDPIQNVGAAVKILSTRVNQYGGEDTNGMVPLNTLALTMAAYNAGAGAVAKYHGIPPYAETQNYVRKVAALYRRFCGG